MWPFSTISRLRAERSAAVQDAEKMKHRVDIWQGAYRHLEREYDVLLATGAPRDIAPIEVPPGLFRAPACVPGH